MSSLISYIAGEVNKILSPFGIVIRRSRAPEVTGTMSSGLAWLSSLGMTFDTIVDIGASDGQWTMLAQQNFVASKYLLIEPLEEFWARLRALCDTQSNLHLATSIAGPQQGEHAFRVTNDLYGSGVAFNSPWQSQDLNSLRSLPMTTVDAECIRIGATAPMMLKFDTHGYEIPILEGAKCVLEVTTAIVMEVYNFSLGPGSLRFHEIIGFLDQHGFRVAYVADLSFRPRDGAFWQMDLFFLRKNHPVFSTTHYS